MCTYNSIQSYCELISSRQKLVSDYQLYFDNAVTNVRRNKRHRAALKGHFCGTKVAGTV